MEPAALDPGDYAGTYKFVGGRLSLDFVNTVSWPSEQKRHDWLDRYPNLVAWARQAGIVDSTTATALLRAGRADERASQRALADVWRQREVLRDVLVPVAAGRSPSMGAVDALNARLGPAAARRRVSRRPLAWAWAPVDSPAAVIAPVVCDAADLLVAGDHSRLGRCAACGWLYFDTTRNRSRRWCDMADCGSRDKSRAYYHRQRAERHPGAPTRRR